MAKMGKTLAGWGSFCEQMSVIQELITVGQLNKVCCRSNPNGQILNFYYNHRTEIDALARPVLDKITDPKVQAREHYDQMVRAFPTMKTAKRLAKMVEQWPALYKKEDVRISWSLGLGWVYNLIRQ